MTERRRVAITGIGAVTPIGISREGLWDGLREMPIGGALGDAVRSRRSFAAAIAAEIDFQATDFIEARRARKLDRFGHFTVATARLAIEDAELKLETEDRERIGSMMGTALGGVGYAEEQFMVFMNEGIKSVSPTLATNVFGGAASCNVAIEFGVMGPNSTNAMSCASGTMAIGEGFRQIRDDYADVMICGGVEAPLNPLCFGAFAIIRAMSTRNDDPARASRPFDRGARRLRDGRRRGSARARGVRARESAWRAHLCGSRGICVLVMTRIT